MKVYEDMKSEYILIRKPGWKAGSEFMVYETEKEIKLILLKGGRASKNDKNKFSNNRA